MIAFFQDCKATFIMNEVYNKCSLTDTAYGIQYFYVDHCQEKNSRKNRKLAGMRPDLIKKPPSQKAALAYT